jgi:hypothetical protein
LALDCKESWAAVVKDFLLVVLSVHMMGHQTVEWWAVMWEVQRADLWDQLKDASWVD